MSATAEDRVYYEAVEAAFIRRRGTPFLLSPSDFALLREWRALGVPLEAVEAGIDEAFTRREERKAVGRVNSLSYCRDAVLERLGTARGDLAGQGRPGRRRSTSTREAALEALALGLEAARGAAARPRRPARVGPGLARAAPGVPRNGAEEVEGSLARLDRKLAKELYAGLPEAERADARPRGRRAAGGRGRAHGSAHARKDDEGADAPQRPRAARPAATEPAVSGTAPGRSGSRSSRRRGRASSARRTASGSWTGRCRASSSRQHCMR